MTTGTPTHCPICLRPADRSWHVSDDPWVIGLQCAVCGKFEAAHLFMITQLKQLAPDDRRRAGLSAYVREANRAEDTPRLTDENWRGHADAYVHSSVGAKLRRLLELAAQRTTRAGEPIMIYQALDYPLVHALEAELSFLLTTLIEQGLLVRKGVEAVVVTAKAWEQLEPLRGGGQSGACFVAMSFADELNPAYDEGIKPAVQSDCGFDDIRVDRVEHVENINDKIIGDIRRSQFLVADFTRHPPGVYFEAGFALGLGKLVIWTCRANDFKDHVHFDTRPYNHILWNDEHDLRAKLRDRIRALVPNAKSA
jgi:nucleoside 2-deoxyribosyltransferase